MSFVVEDGTGTVPTANAYESLAEFKAYWDNVGFDYSSFADSLIQYSIVKATRYLELRFFTQWLGVRVSSDQPLAWPRAFVVDDTGRNYVTGIPTRLKSAISEYAKRALAGELIDDPEIDPTGLQSLGTRKKIGPIEVETKFSDSVSRTIFTPYPAADLLLGVFLKSSGGYTIRA